MHRTPGYCIFTDAKKIVSNGIEKLSSSYLNTEYIQNFFSLNILRISCPLLYFLFLCVFFLFIIMFVFIKIYMASLFSKDFPPWPHGGSVPVLGAQ